MAGSAFYVMRYHPGPDDTHGLTPYHEDPLEYQPGVEDTPFDTPDVHNPEDDP